MSANTDATRKMDFSISGAGVNNIWIDEIILLPDGTQSSESVRQQPPAAANEVCFFDNSNFSYQQVTGADFRTCTGLRSSIFGDAKGHNDAVSAISVGEGVHAIMHDGLDSTGESICIS